MNSINIFGLNPCGILPVYRVPFRLWFFTNRAFERIEFPHVGPISHKNIVSIGIETKKLPNRNQMDQKETHMHVTRASTHLESFSLVISYARNTTVGAHLVRFGSVQVGTVDRINSSFGSRVMSIEGASHMYLSHLRHIFPRCSQHLSSPNRTCFTPHQSTRGTSKIILSS